MTGDSEVPLDEEAELANMGVDPRGGDRRTMARLTGPNPSAR